MTKKIVVAGMHRTGHHPIAVWLLHQQKNIYDFSINTIASWLFKVQTDNGISILANNPLKRGPEEHTDKLKFDDIIADISPNRLILTHEQEKISQVALSCAHSSAVSGSNIKPEIVIVLRDFKNWLASCVKMSQRDNKPIEQIVNDTKVENYIDHFKYVNNKETPTHHILYNQWVTDINYRADICDKLGLKFTDAAINQLSIFGGGSSFDGMKHIKTAWEMDVNTRYKTMEYDQTYQTLLQKYKYVLDISNEVFGKQI